MKNNNKNGLCQIYITPLSGVGETFKIDNEQNDWLFDFQAALIQLDVSNNQPVSLNAK
jgi:hypothetical protein